MFVSCSLWRDYCLQAKEEATSEMRARLAALTEVVDGLHVSGGGPTAIQHTRSLTAMLSGCDSRMTESFNICIASC